MLEPTITDIESAFKKLSNSPAKDYWNLSNQIVKLLQNWLRDHLLNLFNLILKEETFPDNAKVSVIIPVYKGGSRKDPGNYRPISLLSPLSKLLEILLFQQILSFSEKHSCISKTHYGGCAAKSTMGPLLEIRDTTLRLAQEDLRTILVLIDFSKAFDLIDRQLLLNKLNNRGFRGKIGNILSTYLHGRKQCVRLGTTTSTLLQTNKGIPQGSVLSPFLFNLYTSDLHSWLPNITLPQFVDDTSLLVGAPSLQALEIRTQSVLYRVAEWAQNNALLINYSKTKYLIMLKKNPSEKLHLRINNQQIEEVANAKLLGVTIQNNLHWDIHGEHIKTKLAQILGFFYRSSSLFPLYVRKAIYFSLFQTYLTYGLPVWGFIGMTQVKNITTIQKRMLMYLAKGNQDWVQVCKMHKILPFPKLIIYCRAIIAFRAYYGLTKDVVWEKIQGTKIHSHFTRQVTNLRVPFVARELYKQTSNVSLSQTWNLIPEPIRLSRNLVVFKLTLKEWLLQDLEIDTVFGS